MRSGQLVNHYDSLGLKQHELHSLLARGMALPSWLRKWLYRSTQTISLTLELQYQLLQVWDIGLMSQGNVSAGQLHSLSVDMPKEELLIEVLSH